MPIYEYECGTCGHRFEKLMRIGADAPPCEDCGAEEVRKLVSASGFILKGGGWYKDHYGLKGGGSKSTESKSKSADGGSGASSSSTSSASSSSSDS